MGLYVNITVSLDTKGWGLKLESVSLTAAGPMRQLNVYVSSIYVHYFNNIDILI